MLCLELTLRQGIHGPQSSGQPRKGNGVLGSGVTGGSRNLSPWGALAMMATLGLRMNRVEMCGNVMLGKWRACPQFIQLLTHIPSEHLLLSAVLFLAHRVEK